jgi:hypothetical protein
MPMFDLILPVGALPRSALSALVEGLTTTALRWEGIPDNPGTRSAAWAFLWSFTTAQRGSASKVGGFCPSPVPRTTGSQKQRIDVSTPTGSARC